MITWFATPTPHGPSEPLTPPSGRLPDPTHTETAEGQDRKGPARPPRRAPARDDAAGAAYGVCTDNDQS